MPPTPYHPRMCSGAQPYVTPTCQRILVSRQLLDFIGAARHPTPRPRHRVCQGWAHACQIIKVHMRQATPIASSDSHAFKCAGIGIEQPIAPVNYGGSWSALNRLTHNVIARTTPTIRSRWVWHLPYSIKTASRVGVSTCAVSAEFIFREQPTCSSTAPIPYAQCLDHAWSCMCARTSRRSGPRPPTRYCPR